MSNHTEEPWKISKESNLVFIRDKSNNAPAICSVFKPYNDKGLLDAETQEANAKLIAAAPDLLNALELLLKSHEGKGELTGKEVMFLVKAAINKATL